MLIVLPYRDTNMNDSVQVTPPTALAKGYDIRSTAIQQLAQEIRQMVSAKPATDTGHDTQFWLMQFDALIEHNTHNRQLATRFYYTLLSQQLPASLRHQNANDPWHQLGYFLNTATNTEVDNIRTPTV
jgi:hypothetical protein